MPVASVVSIALTTLPPPEATANVTIAPAAALLNWSRAITLGAVATFVLTVAVWALPALSASCVAAPAVPVAVNVTGLPVNPADVAVSVFDPAVVPSVHDPTVAIPLPLVGCEPPATLPPPVATAKVTVTPATALPNESLTATDGAIATLVLTVALCPLPAFRAIVLAAVAIAVAVKVTGLPARLPDVAVRVLVPAVVPSRQLPRVAMPDALVVGVAAVTLPPLDATANVTLTP